MPPETHEQREALYNDMRMMRASMQQIAEAVTQLAVLEEKHNSTATKCEKLEGKIEMLEKIVRDGELERAKFAAKVDGVSSTIRVMWVAFGSGVAFIASQVILFFVKTPK
jgi:hypothetical protein